MNVSDLLNPLPLNHQPQYHSKYQRTRCISSPIIPSYQPTKEEQQNMIGKPRSRFSEYEDNIIRQGVANRLTWGQISDLLPHRKRATCFNRYRTLQGIRKSRKSSSPVTSYYSTSPTSMYHHDTLFYHHSSPTSTYANDISSISSDSSSDENDDYIKQSPPMNHSRVSLPSIKTPPLYYHS